MPLTSKEFDKVMAKLRMTCRDGKHRICHLEHEGRIAVWTQRSQGRGDLGTVEHAIRRQLSVSKKQMQDLIDCPMTREDYLKHLQASGRI